MWRLSAIVAVVVLGLTASAADALEIKNVRSLYGRFGSVRPGNKFMEKDFILLYYDIVGLKISDTGSARFDVTLEAFEKKKEMPNQAQFELGGPVISSSVLIVLGDNKPGKYSAKVTVLDKATKESASFTYNFEIVPTSLGFVHADLPAYGFINNEFSGQVLVVGIARDGKKLQNTDINIRIFDEQGKATLSKPLSSNVPKDQPENLADKDYAMIPLPLNLTRVGVFRVEIEAVDHVSKKTAKLSFPLKVVDPSSVK